MTVGKRLKKLRKKQNKTQGMVAQSLGIPSNTYAQYEIDRREADYDTLNKIADYYGVTLDYLLGRVNDPAATLTDNERKLINSIHIVDDSSLIKETPMTYNGRELSESEKEKVFALIRLLLSDQDKR